MLSFRQPTTSHFAIPTALLYGWLPLSSPAGASQSATRYVGVPGYEAVLGTYEDEAAFHAYEDFSVFCDFCETSTKLKIFAGGTPTSLGTEVIVIC